MLFSSRGIVLHHSGYSESSIIARVYTEQLGLQSYLVNGVRTRKAKFKAGLFSPMTLVELVAYHKDRKGLQRIKEIQAEPQLSHLGSDIIKSSITLFISELLIKSIREEEPNEAMFSFIWNSMQVLDLTVMPCQNYHLFFMIHLSRHLGFFPSGDYSGRTPWFDMQEGVYTHVQPGHPYVAGDATAQYLSELAGCNQDNYHTVLMDRNQRQNVLNALIDYYRLHVSNFTGLKAQSVLEEVFG
jgi:DNA repair protein RecO (recombination protein O)